MGLLTSRSWRHCCHLSTSSLLSLQACSTSLWIAGVMGCPCAQCYGCIASAVSLPTYYMLCHPSWRKEQRKRIATRKCAPQLAHRCPGCQTTCCPFDRDLRTERQTATLLTAVLALPSLQQFRCRRSRVGRVVHFVCFYLDTESCAVAGGLLACCAWSLCRVAPACQPQHRCVPSDTLGLCAWRWFP